MVEKKNEETKNTKVKAAVERSANEPKDAKKLVIITDSREGLSMELVKKFNDEKHPSIVFTTDEDKYQEAGVDGIAFTPTDADIKANGFKYPELMMYIKVTDFVNELDQSLELIDAVENTYGAFDTFINTSTVVSKELLNQMNGVGGGGPASAVQQLATLRSSMGSLQLMARLLGQPASGTQPIQPDLTKYHHRALINATVTKESEPTDADPRNLSINALRSTESYTSEVVSMQQILPETEWPKVFTDKDKGYNAKQVAEMIYLVSQMPESDTTRLIKAKYLL